MALKISVILPVYNKEKYLADILNDIKKQELHEFECIMIDDGSMDDSGTICSEYEKEDTRFHVIHISNSGVSHARNIGLDVARGEYITFIDADDRIPPDYLLNLYNEIKINKTDLVICEIVKTWETGEKEIIKLPMTGTFYLKDILSEFAREQKETGVFGYCCGKLVSRELVNTIRFDERLSLAEDFDFYLKIYRNVKKICFTDATAYYYLQNSENSSALDSDEDIDYYKQLCINIRYRNFLKQKDCYEDENKDIVNQSIDSYLYFTLRYCRSSDFRKTFVMLHQIIYKEDLDVCGVEMIQKWVLFLLDKNFFIPVKITFVIYNLLRKVISRTR